MTIDGLSDADAAGCTKTRRSTSGGCLRVGQHTFINLVVDTEGGVTEQRGIGVLQHGTLSGGCRLSEAGVAPSNHMETKYFWLQQKEKNQELKIAKIRGTVNSADKMMQHLDGKRLVMLCDLLNIKHIGGRPSSAPKLTMDTEYISCTSRAMAPMAKVRQAAANEVAVPSGAEHETRIDHWTVAG